jgi:hypothetical protein
MMPEYKHVPDPLNKDVVLAIPIPVYASDSQMSRHDQLVLLYNELKEHTQALVSCFETGDAEMVSGRGECILRSVKKCINTGE